MISPLLSNLYLNEVDKMLERAKAVTLSTTTVRKGESSSADHATVGEQ